MIRPAYTGHHFPRRAPREETSIWCAESRIVLRALPQPMYSFRRNNRPGPAVAAQSRSTQSHMTFTGCPSIYQRCSDEEHWLTESSQAASRQPLSTDAQHLLHPQCWWYANPANRSVRTSNSSARVAQAVSETGDTARTPRASSFAHSSPSPFTNL